MSTPLQECLKLAQELGLEKLFIKREDINKSGSHKDRAIWYLMKHYLKNKETLRPASPSDGQAQGDEITFVISSSGNAAISAAYYAKDKKIKLHIFISPNISEDKRERLENVIAENITIHESNTAKSDAIKFAKENNYQLIRTSTDDLALEGYKQLAKEIYEQLSNLTFARKGDKSNNLIDIFIPTSSGTTLQGLYEGFQKLTTNNLQLTTSRLHIVQTSKVNAIAKEFDKDFNNSDLSLASAIVDTIAHRKVKVIEAVNQSKGNGWIISDQELKMAKNLLENNTDIKNASWDSLLSLASLIKANKKGLYIKDAILLFTGR